MNLYVVLPGVSCLLLFLTGDATPSDKASGPPEVLVSLPVRRQVTDFAFYPGRTEAVVRVELRARVSGYLVKTAFKEGAAVKEGDLLFEIDPRPYQAELDRARAELAVREARLRMIASQRAAVQQEAAGGKNPAGALEKIAGKLEEAQAAIRGAHAGLEIAQLNLDFTRVRAPCNGTIGRASQSPGNLVRADTTTLAQIVTLDPIDVLFDMDEATLLRLRRGMKAGKSGPLRVSMGLQKEKAFPHEGTVDFIDNQVNPTTGAVMVRGVFSNPGHLMLPGMFARVRLPLGAPHAALLVPGQAIHMQGSQPWLVVVGPDNKIEHRQVVQGSLQDDGLREIVRGIQEKDRIVVGGDKHPKEGTVVTPKMTTTPGTGS